MDMLPPERNWLRASEEQVSANTESLYQSESKSSEVLKQSVDQKINLEKERSSITCSTIWFLEMQTEWRLLYQLHIKMTSYFQEKWRMEKSATECGVMCMW